MGKHETGYCASRVTTIRLLRGSLKRCSSTSLLEGLHIYESACGDGRLAEALKAVGAKVYATDIEDRGNLWLNDIVDFTGLIKLSVNSFDGIITNPPLGERGKLGVRFIEIGLVRMNSAFMAMLLPVDFDSAKTRRSLFELCPDFVGKIILTKRIKWFDMPGKNKSPKENNVWFLWGDVPFREPSNKLSATHRGDNDAQLQYRRSHSGNHQHRDQRPDRAHCPTRTAAVLPRRKHRRRRLRQAHSI